MQRRTRRLLAVTVSALALSAAAAFADAQSPTVQPVGTTSTEHVVKRGEFGWQRHCPVNNPRYR
jgi:opacity protein-like surface antigen